MHVDWETLEHIGAGPETPYAISNAVLALGGIARWWLKDEVRLLAAEDCGHPQIHARLKSRPQLPDTPGSCWVIFVLRSPEKLPRLQPAFLLPLQWVADRDHSSLLPTKLRELAAEVVEAVVGHLAPGCSRWGLQLNPVDGIDRMDLSDMRLGCDSGWASLASGLLLAAEGGRPDPAVWATGCWGPGKDSHTVGQLPAKLQLAQDWGVREFFVPKSMRDEAELRCQQQGSHFRIGPLDLAEGDIVVALRDLLASLDMPPSLSEAGITQQAREWYLRQYGRCQNRAIEYYRRQLLPCIGRSCRERIRASAAVAPTHLVTIASDNQEQISLGVRSLGVTHCQVFHTPDKPLDPWIENDLRQLGIEYERQLFDNNGDLARQFSAAVAVFTKGVPAERVVFDLTPGNKLMSLTLASRVAGCGNWLYYLRHDRDRNTVIPGSEHPQLWRFGESSSDADASHVNQLTVS